MRWTEKQTIHMQSETRERVREIEKYLTKQEYFSNENLNKSRIISIMINTFYELFVEQNSRTYFANRMNQLKGIKSKDNQRILQELSELKILSEFAAYVSMANYQNVKQPEYTPDELHSFQFGEDPEINSLTRRIVELREQDIATYKQIRDSKRKGNKA